MTSDPGHPTLDAPAFAAVVRAHYTGLFDYAYGITRSAEEAEDLVQDVLLWVWEHRAEWRPVPSARAYLFRAVRNRALNAVRNRAVRRRAAEEADASLPAADDPAAGLEYGELVDRYRAAVADLPERRRQVFRLSRLYGLTYEEIGAVLGVSVNTVRTQMTAALRHLRERLDGS